MVARLVTAVACIADRHASIGFGNICGNTHTPVMESPQDAPEARECVLCPRHGFGVASNARETPTRRSDCRWTGEHHQLVALIGPAAKSIDGPRPG